MLRRGLVCKESSATEKAVSEAQRLPSIRSQKEEDLKKTCI